MNSVVKGKMADVPPLLGFRKTLTAGRTANTKDWLLTDVLTLSSFRKLFYKIFLEGTD